MYKNEAIVKSLAPMLHDRFFDPEQVERGAAKKKGKDAWKDELPLQCYHDKIGIYLPVDNIRMMLIGNSRRRGAATILGSDMESKKGSKYKAMCEACIFVHGIEDDQKVYIEPKRAFNPDDYDERSFPDDKGQRHIKRRPLIRMPWSLHFIVEVTENTIHESLVRSLFEVAGFRCGAGAYGPTFGRFEIVMWKVFTTDAVKIPKKRNKK